MIGGELLLSCDWCRSGLVRVTVTRGDGATCGGLLLTKHHVLASAACLGNRELILWQLIIVTSDKSKAKIRKYLRKSLMMSGGKF